MFHLFGRTYLDHDVFYNTKYMPVVLSSVEKPHPISEKLGEKFGTILPFDQIIAQDFNGSLERFWSSMIQDVRSKKTVIFADSECYHQLLIQYWKSIFKNADLSFLHDLYQTHIADNDLKTVMNIERADNYKKLRPGELPRITPEEFETLYIKSPVIECLNYKSKEEVSFEYLLAEFSLEPSGELAPAFLQKLKLLCWRTWLSDVFSLRNDFLGSYFHFDKDLEVKSYLEKNPLTTWFLDPNFHENNIDYICKKYTPAPFVALSHLINPGEAKGNGNTWDSFITVTEALFQGKYQELLQADIENRKGCTFIRDHLLNESNQLLASKIYEDIRLKNIKNLTKFKLA